MDSCIDICETDPCNFQYQLFQSVDNLQPQQSPEFYIQHQIQNIHIQNLKSHQQDFLVKNHKYFCVGEN